MTRFSLTINLESFIDNIWINLIISYHGCIQYLQIAIEQHKTQK